MKPIRVKTQPQEGVKLYHLDTPDEIIITKGMKAGDPLEMVFTTESRDRHGDIVRTGGAGLKHYKKNPVYLWAHSRDLPPLGTVSGLKKEPTRITGHVTFDQDDEFAKMIENKFMKNILRANSIGFLPVDWKAMYEDEENERGFLGWDITKWEMLENSAVPVPANAEALMTGKEFFKEMEWERYVEEFNYPVPEGYKYTGIVVDGFKTNIIQPDSQKSQLIEVSTKPVEKSTDEKLDDAFNVIVELLAENANLEFKALSEIKRVDGMLKNAYRLSVEYNVRKDFFEKQMAKDIAEIKTLLKG